MFAVLTCIFVQHDLRLVAVAAFICIVAASSAFGFHARAIRASGGLRWAWLGLTAMVAGSGVWATHFIAMLAYQPTMKIAYDLPETALSLAGSVLGMGLGFSLPAWWRDRAQGSALQAGSIGDFGVDVDFAKLAAKTDDKTLKLYDGLYHDLLHEPEKLTVEADIETWLLAHLDKAAKPATPTAPPTPAAAPAATK